MVINIFARELASAPDQLKQHLDEGHLDQAANLLHKLSGQAANVGTDGFAREAGLLENTYKAAIVDDDLQRQFEVYRCRLLQDMQPWL